MLSRAWELHQKSMGRLVEMPPISSSRRIQPGGAHGWAAIELLQTGPNSIYLFLSACVSSPFYLSILCFISIIIRITCILTLDQISECGFCAHPPLHANTSWGKWYLTYFLGWNWIPNISVGGWERANSCLSHHYLFLIKPRPQTMPKQVVSCIFPM